MIFRISTKLIVVISSLIIVLFLLVAFLFIKENRQSMSQDIYFNTLAFSRLTAKEVAYSYDVYLEQNSFVYFNRAIQSLFEKNNDVGRIRIVSYTGELLYDSDQDRERKYEGAKRLIDDVELLEQVRSRNLSIRIENSEGQSIGRTVFVTNRDGQDAFVDKYEAPDFGPVGDELVSLFVVPASERYSIIYNLDYTAMELRLAETRERILYLAIFGIMLGVILSFVLASTFTKPIAKLVNAGNEVSKGNLKYRVDIKSRDEMGILGESFNRMTADLEVSLKAKVYQERLSRELELASNIQKQIIPKVLPQVSGLQIAAGLKPAGEIGGDMYDFLNLNDQRLLFYLGDVTGHGVPAGIVSSIANALFFGYSKNPDLKNIMIEVNSVLKAKTMPNIFMTLCLLEWNIVSRNLSYISAGHEQIIRFNANTKLAELEEAGGIALGMIKDIGPHLKLKNLETNVGDYFVIYSDGIPEMWRNEKENFGMENLLGLVQKLGQEVLNAEQMKLGILKSIEDFAGAYPQMDDVTLVVVKVIP